MQRFRDLSVITRFGLVFGLVFIFDERPRGCLIEAGTARLQTEAWPDDATPSDRLQRTDRCLPLANRGDARGETIYFNKCWVRRNVFAKDRDPYLKDLYKHANSTSGEDVAVSSKVNNGGPDMPSFGATLSDSDIARSSTRLKNNLVIVQWMNPRQPSEDQGRIT